jgi:hypothetical protein
MGVLADLPQIGFTIGIGHPVAGLDLDLLVDLILKNLFEVVVFHGIAIKCKFIKN